MNVTARSELRALRGVALAAGVVLAAACGSEPATEPMIAMNMPTEALSDIDAAEWKALASRRIFFGHQSVGRDIMLGMTRVLEAHPEIQLAVVQAEDPNQVDGAGFIDVRIGKNREPQTKSNAFMAALENGFGAEANAIAMYKFCYVDVNSDTDPDQLFREYEAVVEEARREFPDLTIVHFTLPLRTAGTGTLEGVKTRLGLATETKLNAIRNRYNDLLRARFAGKDPVFDLALLESTRPDGSRAFTRYKGRDIYMLAPEWTTDGGHLNEAAQNRFAERLLVFLARLNTGSQAEVADVTGSAR